MDNVFLGILAHLLKMVLWNLNAFRFSDEGHPLLIIWRSVSQDPSGLNPGWLIGIQKEWFMKYIEIIPNYINWVVFSSSTNPISLWV